MSTNSNNEDQKKDIYYQQIVQGWITTRMEKDKSLLTLSAGGIGLLITLLTTTEIQNQCIKYLYFSAIFLFLIVLISVIIIFGENARHLENTINDIERTKTSDRFLKILDSIAIVNFILAIILSFIIAIASTSTSNKIMENKMSKENQNEKKIDRDLKIGSLSGINNLNPSNQKTEKNKSTENKNNPSKSEGEKNE